jgi:dTDP-4-amino-4,6-dideoxygalactose transaminase
MTRSAALVDRTPNRSRASQQAAGLQQGPVDPVPFGALERQHAALAGDLQAAFARVVGANAFILGDEVEHFEAEFADYCGVEHCIGVGSGTAALTIAMAAAGIGRGDEVIVPAHTFIASALSVIHAGATPVFCDVRNDTGLIDADSAAALAGPRTVAIMPVHLYGQACDLDAVQALADRAGLMVVEDAAQAHGATYDGRRAGSFGAAAGFSFYPSKNLGALGDGGAVCTNDHALAARARELRDLGRRGREHACAGFNDRLDGVQAAFLRAKLVHLDEWNGRRREHAGAYRSGLDGALRQLIEDPRAECVYHLFPVRVPDRDALARRLSAAGVQSGIHYSPSLPEQPVFSHLPKPRAELMEAAAWAEEELSLPMFAELEPREVDRVVEVCLSASEERHVG